MLVYILYVCGFFPLESFLNGTALLLAILLPHAKLPALWRPTQVVGPARPPVWARIMLHIGSEDGNSCHTSETNKFLGSLFCDVS